MPSFRAAPVRVRVPATSANLGPGFDSFGLALSLYDDLVVRVADEGLRIDVAGEGESTVPRTDKHLVARAAKAAFAALGGQPHGLEIVCANRIPHGRGLGSSAAAICAGVLAARALTLGGEQTLDDQATFALATELEGHPDNVAACLYGAFTVAWLTPDGPRFIRLTPAAGVVPIAFVPDRQLATSKARALLPECVPHADAAHNTARGALFVEALTRRPELLLEATDDRLHQPYRVDAMPATAALVAELRAADIPAVVSGAGPTVLALAAAADVDRALALAPAAFTPHRLAVDPAGATALPYAAGGSAVGSAAGSSVRR